MEILNTYGTDFLLAHFQGGCWQGLYPVVSAYEKRRIELPPEVSVVTVASNPELCMLIKQLTKSGVPFLNDFVFDGQWWTNTMKIAPVVSALRRVETRYVLVLDASDVLFARSPLDILDRFAAYEDKRLLFGATKHEHPKRLIDKIADRDFRGPFRHLNAGTAFGYTVAAREFYARVREKHESDEIDNPDNSEQLIVRHTFAECTDWVDFDYRCSIFQTFGGVRLVEIDGATETYKVN